MEDLPIFPEAWQMVRKTDGGAKAQLAAAKQLVETLEPTVAEGEARLPELAAALPALREAAAAAQETYDAAAAAADLSGKQAAYEAAQSRANTAKSERDAAQAQVDALMAEMARSQGVNEALKAANQMDWVQKMNNFRNAAMEIVTNELIYR